MLRNMPMADHFLGVQKTISWGASKARLVVGAAPLKQSGWDGEGCRSLLWGPCVSMSRGDTCVSGNLVVEGSRGPAPCVCVCVDM